MPPKTAKPPKEKSVATLPPATKAIPEERSIPASRFTRYGPNRVPKDDAVMEMAESIRENGQLQPITCRSIGRVSADDPEQFEIIFGETRWLGCAKIHADFPVRAYVLDVDDKEAAKIHAIENFQRRDLDDIEQGEAMKNMLSNGWTMEEVMNHLGCAKDHIYRRLSILKLPPEAKQAFRDKQISLRTADALVSLPEEKQLEALKKCTEPTYSDSPLPERQALDLIDREFIQPIKRAKSWEERRAELEEKFPGAQWLSYAEASVFGRDRYNEIEKADDTPDAYYLTEKAQEKSTIELPTWGELARKHALPGIIAIERYGSDAVLYIPTLPVIAAERAADADSFFADPEEKNDPESSDKETEAAKRKAEAERRAELDTKIEGERLKMIEHVLSGKHIAAGATRKLVVVAFEAIAETDYGEWDDMLKIFPGAAEDADYDVIADHCRAEIGKLLKQKGADPYMVFARVALAAVVARAAAEKWSRPNEGLAHLAFGTGAFKRADFPALNERFPQETAASAESQPEGETA